MADFDDKDNIVETVDEDGNVINFKLFDIIEFENKEYALLLPFESEEDEDELVIMRLVKDEEEYSFETIDDDDEFDRVSEYLEELGEEE
ncbi:DUF1292 domain-containing protein [bacterium]|nr:DUF1292 domain-containing protein [bacterium]